MSTHLISLLNSNISLGRDAEILGLDVDDDKGRVGSVAAEELVDLEVGRADLGACAVPSDHVLSCCPTVREGGKSREMGENRKRIEEIEGEERERDGEGRDRGEGEKGRGERGERREEGEGGRREGRGGGRGPENYIEGKDCLNSQIDDIIPLTFLNIVHMFSWKLWSRNQIDGFCSSSSKGTSFTINDNSFTNHFEGMPKKKKT